jgi:uncharacterized membrane protein
MEREPSRFALSKPTVGLPVQSAHPVQSARRDFFVSARSEMYAYGLLKSVHVFAVIIFVGNIITGLFWKFHADRTKSREIIAHTMRGLIGADRWFTIPGVVVITTAGILTAIKGQMPLIRTHWILWSMIAFSLSGIAFMWKVSPLQKKLLAMTEGEGELDWKKYRSKSLEWELWGLFATITPIIAVVLMTSKPAL